MRVLHVQRRRRLDRRVGGRALRQRPGRSPATGSSPSRWPSAATASRCRSRSCRWRRSPISGTLIARGRRLMGRQHSATATAGTARPRRASAFAFSGTLTLPGVAKPRCRSGRTAAAGRDVTSVRPSSRGPNARVATFTSTGGFCELANGERRHRRRCSAASTRGSCAWTATSPTRAACGSGSTARGRSSRTGSSPIETTEYDVGHRRARRARPARPRCSPVDTGETFSYTMKASAGFQRTRGTLHRRRGRSRDLARVVQPRRLHRDRQPVQARRDTVERAEAGRQATRQRSARRRRHREGRVPGVGGNEGRPAAQRDRLPVPRVHRLRWSSPSSSRSSTRSGTSSPAPVPASPSIPPAATSTP